MLQCLQLTISIWPTDFRITLIVKHNVHGLISYIHFQTIILVVVVQEHPSLKELYWSPKSKKKMYS